MAGKLGFFVVFGLGAIKITKMMEERWRFAKHAQAKKLEHGTRVPGLRWN